MEQSRSEISNSIALNNSSVSQCIYEMAEDVEKQWIANSASPSTWWIYLEAILLASVRFIDDRLREEVLLC